MLRRETSDPVEAVGLVERVYCAHELSLDRRATSVRTRLSAVTDHALAQVALEYGARVTVDAGRLDGITLVMHSTQGRATAWQRNRRVEWSAGRTVIMSANQPSRFEFDPMFAQSSLRLDPDRIRSHCERLVGSSLDREVVFEPVLFSPRLESLWAQVLALSFQRQAIAASGVDYLHDFALDLLLHHCPHNRQHLLQRQGREVPRLAQEATDLIESIPDHEVLTVVDVAGRLAVSARSLERAFRDAFGIGPGQYLGERRLDRVRRHLEQAPRGSRVSDLAAAQGFYHPGRFAAQYRQRFGESPSATLGTAGGGSGPG